MLVSLSILAVLLVACSGCEKSKVPVQTTTSSTAQQKEARAKTVALQQFQGFRTSSTLSAGVKSLSSMYLALGSVGLTNADINVSDAEIVSHIRDLAHRNQKAKSVTQHIASKKHTQHRK